MKFVSKYQIMMDYKYFITSVLVDIGLRVFQSRGRLTGIFFTPIKFFENNKSIVPQIKGLLLSEQWTIQRNFYTTIPKRASKLWCPKKRKCTFPYNDILRARLCFLNLTVSKFYFQEKVKLHQLPSLLKFCRKVFQK